MKRKLLLSIWVLAMLFPLNWLRRQSLLLRRFFDAAFSAEWVHVLMHMLLYAVLVMLLVRTFHLPHSIRTALILIGTILLIGIVQEAFQLIVKSRPWNCWDSFDLLVDLVGGAIGYGLSQFINSRRCNT